MRTLLIAGCILNISLGVYGQGILNSIPDSLQEGTNEIVLYDNTHFVIEGIDKASYKQSYKAIILNKKASDRNYVRLDYSDFWEIKDAEIHLYNMNGKEFEKFKLKDFDDYSTKGYSIADDSRAKIFRVISNSYPYIIEVTYEYSVKGTMFYPTWIPQSDDKQSIIRATLTVESQIDEGFRHKSINVQPETTSTNQKMTWRVDSLVAYENEPYSPHREEYMPMVYLAPNVFTMGDYTGEMKTWNDFGTWQNQLLTPRNTLTPDQLAPIFADLPTDASDLEITRFIYNYLQQNTRYVSVQLGIGGWQPFESGFVHEKKYGDCKALTFYTKSLLEIAGVDSYYTLITAGPKPGKILHPDFPASTFNHVILTVPIEGDTVWLECTSQTNPFGYLGHFTSDRDALMITNEGAKVIHTRSYQLEDNVQSTKASITIAKDGSAQIELQRDYSGLEIENDGFDRACKKSSDEQAEWFIDEHDWGSVKLNEITLTEPSREAVPKGKLKVSLNSKNAASVNGNRFFYKPFVFTDISYIRLNADERKRPLIIKYPYMQIDTLEVSFPEGFMPEASLSDVLFDSDFGAYERIINKSDSENKYLLIRKFSLKAGEYQKEDYQEFREFVRSVQKHDRQRMVLLNKT